MRGHRAAGAVLAAGLLWGATPGTAVAAEEPRGAQPMRQTETFIDTVPCAPDEGLFRITTRFNGFERMTERGGQFLQTGRFRAVPVTESGESREGAAYSGSFTISGTMRANKNVTTETFRLRINGTSAEGDTFKARALFHLTVVRGETKVSIERERCL